MVTKMYNKFNGSDSHLPVILLCWHKMMKFLHSIEKGRCNNLWCHYGTTHIIFVFSSFVFPKATALWSKLWSVFYCYMVTSQYIKLSSQHDRKEEFLYFKIMYKPFLFQKETRAGSWTNRTSQIVDHLKKFHFTSEQLSKL